MILAAKENLTLIPVMIRLNGVSTGKEFTGIQ